MAIDRFARLKATVDAVMSARRKLWEILCSQPHKIVDQLVQFDEEETSDWRAALDLLFSPLMSSDEWQRALRHRDGVDIRFLETHAFLRPFLRDLLPRDGRGLLGNQMRADVAYLVWRNIKTTHSVTANAEIQHTFRRICDILARPAWADVSRAVDGKPGPVDRVIWPKAVDVTRADLRGELRDGIIDLLRPVLPQEHVAAHADEYIELFFDVCFSLEDLDRGGVCEGVQVRLQWLDPNFLLSRLYGTRTGIPGFDVLFEGGINLADPWTKPLAPVRTILIRGQFNAGKSILALSLATEVARKGGSVTVVSLENSLDALKGYVSSFNLAEEPGQVGAVSQGIDTGPSSEIVNFRTGGGVLTILYSPSASISLEELLNRVKAHIAKEAEIDRAHGAQRPRLLVIDPVNSLVKLPPEAAKIRAEVLAAMAEVGKHVGNILLVAETAELPDSGRDNMTGGWTDVLPYIADVVIDLSHDRQHGYDQRYIQVSKSRMQRERRGRHPIAIVPGGGMVIAPSSVAFRSEIAWPRWADENRPPIKFGLRDLDTLLPDGALTQGDSIVLRGPQGSFKTLLGLYFLGADRHESRPPDFRRKSLFLTDRGELPLSTYIDAYRLLLPSLEDRVTFAPLRRGYVQPGRLLRDIQSYFEDGRARGEVYDRVMIANIGRWDVNCPFIRDDPGFGNALMDLLRWEGASSILICGNKHDEKDSKLQREVTDRATALLDFERVEFEGAQRVLTRIVRSRSAPRSREWHEVTLQGGGLQLDQSLLRVREQGEGLPPQAETVKTTLNLFQVGDVQKKYHQDIRDRLRSVLTTPVEVNAIDRGVLQEAARLGPLSVGSHLQIVQIDEYQLPALKHSADGRSMLQPFPVSIGKRWADDPGLLNAITRHEYRLDSVQSNIVALPYYRNLAFLTITDKEAAEVKGPFDEWSRIAKLAAEWQGGDDQRPFFNFARRNEDFNCLFLEIAISLAKEAPLLPTAGADDEASFEGFRQWLKGRVFEDALVLFHGVCSRAHHTKQDKDWDQGPPPWSGVITRQWFTALRYWLDREPAKAVGLSINSLPGSVALSGEWCLGIWAHSAVPEIGLKIIDSLASSDAQLERLGAGIGLPIDANLFVQDPRQFFPWYKREPHIDVGALVKKAQRRSQLFKYHLLAPILSQHLINFLDVQTSNIEEVKKEAEDTRERLLKNVDEVLRPKV